ncbi:hypothetical protein RRG08_032213 [Elysia crispata]|uniref:Uncharacterized protein n=1 Tax=Elysia crispata TaxID=231223 RepID=A0AAE1ABB0_9GAST|nr:hypothetical protein RRG08_032213 [Elysia crispata]
MAYAAISFQTLSWCKAEPEQMNIRPQPLNGNAATQYMYFTLNVSFSDSTKTLTLTKTKSKEREELEEKGLIEKKESDQEKESGRSKESRMKRQKEGEEAENKNNSIMNCVGVPVQTANPLSTLSATSSHRFLKCELEWRALNESSGGANGCTSCSILSSYCLELCGR